MMSLITFREFARRAGVDHRTAKRWLVGDRSKLRLLALERCKRAQAEIDAERRVRAASSLDAILSDVDEIAQAIR